jgi:AbiJ N-terminal domain 4
MRLRLFSHRKGLKAAEKLAQIDGADNDLRVALWNIVDRDILGLYHADPSYLGRPIRHSNLYQLFEQLWELYFKRPIDTIPSHIDDGIKILRDYVFTAPWNEVYDIIEFLGGCLAGTSAIHFAEHCNASLERENSAYRFIGGEIAPLTSEHDIAAVEMALTATQRIATVHEHLNAALRLLADRASPDYRNSIKESISAVEALCRLITGDPTATLGKALARIESRIALHGAFKQALSSLYGYTSDAQGIRHALMDDATLTAADARFMLTSCSAFVSYLLALALQAGIKL